MDASSSSNRATGLGVLICGVHDVMGLFAQVELLERALAIMEAAVAAEGGSGGGAAVGSGTTVVSATGKRVEVLRKRLAALKGLKKTA